MKKTHLKNQISLSGIEYIFRKKQPEFSCVKIPEKKREIYN